MRPLARPSSLAIALATLALAAPASAVGEAKNGFPNWEERVLLEWSNRARCEPSVEMTKCGAACGEAACFSPIAPLYWSDGHSHSARFHSDEMVKQGYFAHDSKCALPTNISTLYPATCDGSASCACTTGSPTSWAARIGLFGVDAGGEIIASPSDPDSAFYLWLFENSASTACAFSLSNGHRWNILTAGPAVGYGVSGYSSGDFGSGGDVYKIASGSHYPRGGPDVDVWASWYDAAAPKSALVNVGGTCHPMTRARGTDTNGAWTYHATGLGACVRYTFEFTDSSGAPVVYPSTGSLGIGDASCAAWDPTRPPEGSGCGPCTPSCGGKTCGDDGCGGSCGACGAGQTCGATGACVSSCAPSCTGKTCGDDGCGGSCGSCPPSEVCSKGACATSCAPPLVTCGSACVDTQKDPAHCGTCASACKPGQSCVGGRCVSGGVDGGGDAPGGDVGGDAPGAEGGRDGGIGGPLDDASFDATTPDGLAPDPDFQGSCGCRAAGGDASGSTLGGLGALAGLVGVMRSFRRRRAPARLGR